MFSYKIMFLALLLPAFAACNQPSLPSFPTVPSNSDSTVGELVDPPNSTTETPIASITDRIPAPAPTPVPTKKVTTPVVVTVAPKPVTVPIAVPVVPTPVLTPYQIVIGSFYPQPAMSYQPSSNPLAYTTSISNIEYTAIASACNMTSSAIDPWIVSLGLKTPALYFRTLANYSNNIFYFSSNFIENAVYLKSVKVPICVGVASSSGVTFTLHSYSMIISNPGNGADSTISFTDVLAPASQGVSLTMKLPAGDIIHNNIDYGSYSLVQEEVNYYSFWNDQEIFDYYFAFTSTPLGH